MMKTKILRSKTFKIYVDYIYNALRRAFVQATVIFIIDLVVNRLKSRKRDVSQRLFLFFV